MSTPFLSEIRIMSFNYAPKGWAPCNGQLLPINQNQALFSLLGTTYGGDGRINFGLPNLQGRVPMSYGNGHVLGERGGEQAHTLIKPELGIHFHGMMAKAVDAATGGTGRNPGPTGAKSLAQGHASQGPGVQPVPVSIYANAQPSTTLNQATIGNTGGGQPHENMQPYLSLNFCIALQGIFPSPT
jgi:microcystin-dependent protein